MLLYTKNGELATGSGSGVLHNGQDRVEQGEPEQGNRVLTAGTTESQRGPKWGEPEHRGRRDE